MRTIKLRFQPSVAALRPVAEADQEMFRHIVKDLRTSLDFSETIPPLIQEMAAAHNVELVVDTSKVWCKHMDLIDLTNEINECSAWKFCPMCGVSKPQTKTT